MIDAYTEGEIGALYIVYTRFINTMKQEPVVEQLLPLTADRLQRDRPHRARRLGLPLRAGREDGAGPAPRAATSRPIIYQALAENIASEQSARMVAMKAASDNASSVIDQLTLVYNKSRQAAITKELSEIVGGAAAV